MEQYPHELSGGLRQRVMIAISIAAEPKLLIADEPTTALDVTVQAQVLALLKNLQVRLGMALILITHDIGVVAGCAAPQHPYTRGLIDAIPRPEDAVGAPFRGLPGAPPELAGPVAGCAFAPRCSSAVASCSLDRPALIETGHGGVRAACPVVREARLHGEAG